jgi:hypothetical protein
LSMRSALKVAIWCLPKIRFLARPDWRKNQSP